MKLTTRALDNLLQSPRVLGKSIVEVNGDSAEPTTPQPALKVDGARIGVDARLTNQEHTEKVLQSPAFADIQLHLFWPDEAKQEAAGHAPRRHEATVRKLQAALLRNFEKALSDLVERDVNRETGESRKSVDRQTALLEQARAELEKHRERLREVTTGLPQKVLEESVANLQRQQQSLQLDIVGLKVREGTIRKQVAEVSEELKKARPDDTALKYLERVLQVRMDQLKRLREIHRQGAAPATEVAKAEEEVALAQVNLAQANREAGKPISDRLEKLNAELAQIAVSRVEAQAKVDFVELRLAEAREALQIEASTAQPLREQIAAEADAAHDLAVEARKRRAELAQQEASYRPARVEVFDLQQDNEDKSDARKADGAPKEGGDLK